jgi:hypothetical protein
MAEMRRGGQGQNHKSDYLWREKEQKRRECQRSQKLRSKPEVFNVK